MPSLPAATGDSSPATDKRKPDTQGEREIEVEYDGLPADAFRDYAKRTYENGLPPLAVGQKVDAKPPGKVPWHSGYSGRAGVDADLDEIDRWPDDVVWRIYRGAQGILNLGMRKPIGGIGIDVDDYVAADGRRKHGLRTIAEHTARLGPLPPTYRLSARPYDTGAGIRLYRVPEGWEGRERLKTEDGGDGHVELIQRHHRHSLIPPSIRPDLGDGVVVRLYDERTGKEIPDGIVPPLADWPEFPEPWLADLGKAARAGADATAEEVEAFRDDCSDDYWPHLLNPIVKRLRAERNGTYDATRDELCRAARQTRVGCYPWARAVEELEAAARESYAERGVPDKFDANDFGRLEQYAVGQALADDVGELQRRAARDLWAPIPGPPRITWERFLAIKRMLDRNGWRILHTRNGSESPASNGRVTRCLADVEPTKVEWLWRPWLPLGKVSILEGDPDVGKSVLTIAWAAAVSQGRDWPRTIVDGTTLPREDFEPAGAVLVGVEDDDADTVVPRLIAAGADRNRIHTMLQPVDKNGDPVPFVIPDGVDLLRKAIEETNAKVVVIDPITAFLSTAKAKSGDDPSTRQALMPLVLLAAETGCAIVLVRHLNKATGMSAKHRGSGTIAYTGITRSVIVAGKLKEPITGGPTHAIALTKGNLTKQPMAIGYQLDSAPNDADSPVVVWCGPIDLSADQLVGADGAKVSDARKNAPARQGAEDALKDLLADGEWHPVNEVRKEAMRIADCGKKTVDAAAKKLGLQRDKVYADGKIDHWSWRLPPKPTLRVVKDDDPAPDGES